MFHPVRQVAVSGKSMPSPTAYLVCVSIIRAYAWRYYILDRQEVLMVSIMFDLSPRLKLRPYSRLYVFFHVFLEHSVFYKKNLMLG